MSLLLAVAGAIWAQTAGASKPAAESEAPEAVRQLVRTAQALEPEFGADVLLRLVESGKLRGREETVAALQTAWDLAGRAQEGFNLQSIVRNIDTRDGHRSVSFSSSPVCTRWPGAAGL